MTPSYQTSPLYCVVASVSPETLSAEECYRINGMLTSTHIEQLLDCADMPGTLRSVDAYLCDIDGGPEEDFAADILADLGTIADGMRGGPRQLSGLRAVIADLEELQATVGRATEFNNEGIKKARNLIDAAQ